MSQIFGRIMYICGRALRETGQALDRQGCRLQGNYAFMEPLSRHRRLAPLYDKWPRVNDTAYVAPSAAVVGNVQLGERAAVWYGAVVRGDVNSVSIGARSQIGDDAVVHCAGSSQEPLTPARATVLGDDVILGEGAIVHACTLHNGAWVQSGAIVLDGSEIGEGAIVEAGALVTGKKVRAREVWAGNPAKKVRDVSEADAQQYRQRLSTLVELSAQHDAEHAKTAKELQRDKEQWRVPHWGKGFDSLH